VTYLTLVSNKSSLTKVGFKVTPAITLTTCIVFLIALFSTVYDDIGSSKNGAYALLPTTLKVNIQSPVDGQQVPTGNLQIAGNSTDDAQIDCVVSVALNRKTPYQTAIATGSGGGGANDYSSWTFTTNSSYAIIEPGQNRIAARISCPENPTLVKGTHINVTGASSGNLPSQTTMAPSQPPTSPFPTPIPAPYAEQRPPSAAPSTSSIQGVSSVSSSTADELWKEYSTNSR
jgi:hypothetical protein